MAPVANVKPFSFGVGGVCISTDWLHFDVVFRARSKIDPATVEGMAPLLDKAALLPDQPVTRPDRRQARGFNCVGRVLLAQPPPLPLRQRKRAPAASRRGPQEATPTGLAGRARLFGLHSDLGLGLSLVNDFAD